MINVQPHFYLFNENGDLVEHNYVLPRKKNYLQPWMVQSGLTTGRKFIQWLLGPTDNHVMYMLRVKFDFGLILINYSGFNLKTKKIGFNWNKFYLIWNQIWPTTYIFLMLHVLLCHLYDQFFDSFVTVLVHLVVHGNAW